MQKERQKSWLLLNSGWVCEISNALLQLWEKISAAFRYALFDAETDHCADDVFNRADQNMYERKKVMKATKE